MAHRSLMIAVASILLLSITLPRSTNALIHHLEIRNDNRGRFFIENFGFEGGGTLILNCTNTVINPQMDLEDKNNILGFYIKRSNTDTPRFIEEHEGETDCLFNIKTEVHESRIRIDSLKETSVTIQIRPDAPGFYNVYFISCFNQTRITPRISFDLDLVMYNPGPNYLSIGQSVEPTIFAFMFLVYVIIFFLWVFAYMRGSDGKRVFAIHYLMTLLLVLKMSSVLFHGLELHYLKNKGHAGGWGVVYYILTSMRGIMMFIVIALIGSGWAFIKPFLSERDKKIFLIVIPLQILDNIALVVVEATAPGSQGWFTWQDIFRVVDIICCIAVLVPIIWSIRHLKEASSIDGKAAQNLEKLRLFRHFYLMVVSYIYFTRIIVYLLDATLPFRWTWVGVFVTEIATLAFYSASGYMFRPMNDNPVLKLDHEDPIEENEMNISMQPL